MACIRIKRLRSEDPSEAISIVRKKRRISVENAAGGHELEVEQVATVWKFIATVSSKSDCIDEHVKKAISADTTSRPVQNQKQASRRHPKAHSNGLNKSKAREESETTREESRYKLISTLRGFENETTKGANVEATDKSLFHLYDALALSNNTEDSISKSNNQVTCNGIPMVVLEEEGACGSLNQYVFDVYYSNDANINDLESLDECINLSDELDYDNASDDSDIGCEDEDDSNDECNWRNDYPDEDDDYEQNRSYYQNYDESEDYINGMMRCSIAPHVDDAEDDSSDDDHDDDGKDVKHVDVDEGFLRLHGLKMARFLTKVKAGQKEGVPIEKIKVRRFLD